MYWKSFKKLFQMLNFNRECQRLLVTMSWQTIYAVERDDAERSDAPALLLRGVSRGSRCINLFVRPTIAFNKPPLSLSIERASESAFAAWDNRRRLVGRFHQTLKMFQHFSRIAFYCHCIVWKQSHLPPDYLQTMEQCKWRVLFINSRLDI